MAMSNFERAARRLHLKSFGRLATVAAVVFVLIAGGIYLTQTPMRDNNANVTPTVAQGPVVTDLPSDLQDVVNWDDDDNPVVSKDPDVIVETQGGWSTLETLNEGEN